MDGPSDELRSRIDEELRDSRGSPDEEAELRLMDVLEDIERMLQEDVGAFTGDIGSVERALSELGAIEAWAALVSNAVGWIYAPASPYPRRLAGWAKTIAERLRWLVGLLLGPLSAVARTLGVSTYSIGLSFPWGVSVSLGWE